jgi:hypothetical protein
MFENRRLNLTRGSNKKVQNLRKCIKSQRTTARVRTLGTRKKGGEKGKTSRRIRIDQE